MIFNRDVLQVNEKYFEWSDQELEAHYLPQMRETAMSRKHHEEAAAKATKKALAATKKLESEAKKALLVEKRAKVAEEKAKLAAMTPEQVKQYKKSKKLQQQLDAGVQSLPL